ncbi:hypothetical protein N7504_006265 [Penicillium tannophilum]|nr:hypothetical protein N7504_006265 [Penicillium tannophilum]
MAYNSALKVIYQRYGAILKYLYIVNLKVKVSLALAANFLGSLRPKPTNNPLYRYNLLPINKYY